MKFGLSRRLGACGTTLSSFQVYIFNNKMSYLLIIKIYLLLVVGLTIEQQSTVNSHEVKNFNDGFHHQYEQINQRKSAANQPAHLSILSPSTTIHPRGGHIMPPNNQDQANIFRSSVNQPTAAKYRANNGVHSMEQSSSKINSPTAARLNNEHPNHHSDAVMDGSYLQGNIELALRQTSSDESVFQPSPAIGIPDHNLGQWSVSRPNLVTQGPQMDLSRDDDGHQQQHKLQQQTSTTEQSNFISQSREAPSIEQYLQMGPSGSQLSEQQRVTAGNLHQNSSGQDFALSNNNVFYEGPATAPPSGDYYFSSSERLPSYNEKASNVWWALGVGAEFERANNLTRDDYLDYCSKSELLISNKQRSLCRTHPKVMAVVARGLKLAIDECQARFTHSRWNCSLVLQKSMTLDQQPPSGRMQTFGDVMKHPNRERSFLNAIVAAGLAHAMTEACSAGELPEECNCDKMIRSKSNRNKIEWVACSDDIDFGAKFSREFTDNTDNESDTTSMISTHNYEVGRRVFKSATDITCTCQDGENGLCQTKKCWKHLGSFRDIGDELMKRYEGATHVQLSNRDPHKLRPVRRGVRKPKRKDLVYIDESPDYCTPNSRLGVLGTQNRRCNSTSSGADSCSLLCCGRGYQIVVEDIEEDCNCKFVWCCQVKCEKCKRHTSFDVCN